MRALTFVIIAALVGAACKNNDTTGPTSTPRGEFTITDLVVGTGAEAINGRSLTVNYTGWLYDPSRTDGKGNQFDSNAGLGPLRFVLGASQVIQGWDRGVVGMRIGGRRRLIIPPELAYGTQSPDPRVIPPNATLVFDIELLTVQ